MNFENFPLSRDLAYAGIALTGIVLGMILHLFPPGTASKRKKDLLIPAALLVLSAAIVFVSLAIIQSRGDILTVKDFYLPGAITLVLFILASRFPRALGFPLVLLAGLLIVLGGFFFQPLVKVQGAGTVLAAISRSAGDSEDRIYRIQISGISRPDGNFHFKTGTGPSPEARGQTGTALKISSSELTIRSIRLYPAGIFPFFGGTVLAAISGISSRELTLYELFLPGKTRLLPASPQGEGQSFGIRAVLYEELLDLDKIETGFSVYAVDTPHGLSLLFH
jgi:hypothetical protein